MVEFITSQGLKSGWAERERYRGYTRASARESHDGVTEIKGIFLIWRGQSLKVSCVRDAMEY